MKARAIPKKAACVASSLALALTMVPAAGIAAAPSQALAAEGETPPIISVTAPFHVTFGSKEAPYDVTNPTPYMNTTSYFKNNGTMGLSVYSVECNAPDNTGNKDGQAVLETKDASKPLTDASQKIFSVWDSAAGEDQAIHFGYYNNGDSNKLDITNYTLDKFLGVPAGGTTDVTYRLNLDNDYAKAKVREGAAQPEAERKRQSLGTVKFTFGRIAPIGDQNAAYKANPGTYSTTAGFYLKDNISGQVYSVDKISEMSEDLSDKGEASPYYSLFDSYIKNDGSYECKTTWDVTYPTYLTERAEGENPSKFTYNVRLVGMLHDYISSGNGKKAGLTFQLVNALHYANTNNVGDGNEKGTSAENDNYSTWKLFSSLNPRSADNPYDATKSPDAKGFFFQDVNPSLMPHIKPVSKWCMNNVSGKDSTRVDDNYLFLPSVAEMCTLPSGIKAWSNPLTVLDPISFPAFYKSGAYNLKDNDAVSNPTYEYYSYRGFDGRQRVEEFGFISRSGGGLEGLSVRTRDFSAKDNPDTPESGAILCNFMLNEVRVESCLDDATFSFADNEGTWTPQMFPMFCL